MKIHVVAQQIGGFAREDAPQMQVVAALTNDKEADKLAKVVHGKVFAIEVDAIPEGYRQEAAALGLSL